MRGLIYHVLFARGHNNDQGLFKRTFADYISRENIVGLGDRAYTHPCLLTPDTRPDDSMYTEDEWSLLHAAHRAPVEIANALVKNWRFAAWKVKTNPEYQAMSLFVIYSLVNLNLTFYPLRLFPNSVNK
jgi:hypothetical protein